MALAKAKLHDDLRIPNNFVKTAAGYTGGVLKCNSKQPEARLNPQTSSFCKKLSVDDPVALLIKNSGSVML